MQRSYSLRRNYKCWNGCCWSALAILTMLLGAGCSHSPATGSTPNSKATVAGSPPSPSDAAPIHEGSSGSTANADDLLRQGKEAEQNKDFTSALALFRQGADAGSAEAMNRLGTLYAKGDGASQSYSEAYRWYSLAAAAGWGGAMYNLGNMYAQGIGVTQDYSQAVGWFRKGADAGCADAMYNLGVLYAHGSGVSQDYSQAIYWYEKGAAAGSSESMYNMGAMYRDGIGVPHDDATALMWYRRAADAGDQDAAENIRKLEAAQAENGSTNRIPPCTVEHEGDGAGIPCIDPYTGNETDFYNYKQSYSHDPYR